jgi:hypothetical protein
VEVTTGAAEVGPCTLRAVGVTSAQAIVTKSKRATEAQRIVWRLFMTTS